MHNKNDDYEDNIFSTIITIVSNDKILEIIIIKKDNNHE